MSTQLTEAASDADFITGLTVPTSGESGTVWWGIIIAALQQLSDRSQALKLASPGVVSTQLPLAFTSALASSHFSIVTQGAPLWYQSDTSAAGSLFLHLDQLPPGMVITSITVRWSGNAGPGGTPHVTAGGTPVTMPTLRLYYHDIGTNSQTTVGTATDASASAAVYDALHDITLTVNHTVITGKQYYIRITGETGSFAVDDASGFYSLYMTLTSP